MLYKTFVIFLAILLTTFFTKAQSIPKFGKLDAVEFASTDCSYDPKAPAEILINQGETRFEWDNKNFFKMITDRRIRIKILTQKGLDYANIKIRYQSESKYERINNIAGHTYNLVDGKIDDVKLEKKLIYEKKINDQMTEISFGLPNVKVGSIIEYRYTEEKDSYSNIDNWLFQREIPVRLSTFTIEIPEYFRFVTRVLSTMFVDKTQKEENRSLATSGGILKYNCMINTYTIQNIPSLKREAYMASLRDYIQRLEFQLSAIVLPNSSVNYTTNWEELAKELRESEVFGQQIKRKVSLPELDDKIDKLPNNLEKLKATYTFFKKNFIWNEVEDFTCLNVKKVADTKTGTSGDLNLLFLSKLKEYDIESYPILISTKENGSVNTLYPFLKQFNTLMAYIPISDKYYIINAADKYNAYNLIPYDAVNTQGLKIEKSNSSWVSLYDETMIEKILFLLKWM